VVTGTGVSFDTAAVPVATRKMVTVIDVQVVTT
jgi:hypothetical protein